MFPRETAFVAKKIRGYIVKLAAFFGCSRREDLRLQPSVALATTAPTGNPRTVSQLNGALYEWPVNRPFRTFRAGVVEVGRYSPTAHAPLFEQALRALTTGYVEQAGVGSRTKSTLRQFDLVTFPEAFLPLAALGSTLRSFGAHAAQIFIHVGLRLDAISEDHLVPVPQMISFVEGLVKDSVVLFADVGRLREWLAQQPTNAKHNFGCVFGVDANGDLRVCLHPKMVRSNMEEGARRHAHMADADLLSVVILDPTERNQMPVYIQPLLCSDALVIPMDRPTHHHPLLAITSRVVAFPRSVEHIDVVSIASCTRQSSDRYVEDGELKQQWQREFLDSARRIAEKEDARSHHGAILLKANYCRVKEFPNAGLSGFFIPHPLQEPRTEAYVHQSVYATTANDDSRWLAGREIARVDWKNTRNRNRGYVVAVADASTQASLLAFEVTRLSRDARGWGMKSMLRDLRVYDLVPGDETDVFVERGT